MIYSYLVLLGIVLFALLGLRRGWLQEVATLGGLLFAWLLVLALGSLFVSAINRLALIARFTFVGGFDSAQPGPLLEAMRRAPLLVPRRPDVVLGIVFVLLAATAFLLAAKLAPPATSGSARALGLLVGVANGYLVCYLAFRFLIPAARLELGPVNLPDDIATSLGRYLPTVLLVGVLLTVALALVSSRRLGGKGGGRMAPSRAKG